MQICGFSLNTGFLDDICIASLLPIHSVTHSTATKLQNALSESKKIKIQDFEYNYFLKVHLT